MNPIISTMIRYSGRSWWQARFSDGRTIAEWDTLTSKRLFPIGKGSSSRWEETPKKGMIGLRLLCPNGMAGELEAPEGCRFFQLKVGGQMVKLSPSTPKGFTPNVKNNRHFQDAHIIGVVKNIEGGCLCRAWETVVEVVERGKTTETIPIGKNFLVDTNKSWTKNQHLGKTIHVFGVSAIIWGNSDNTIKIMGKWPETIPGSPSAIPNRTDYMITAMQKRLIEFEDNIHNMRYRNIGPLSLEVQGVKT